MATTTTPTAPASTLAIAGLALLVFPKAVKTVAYGALALYAFQLYKMYQTQGTGAVTQAAKLAFTSGKDQLTAIQNQEAQLFMKEFT